MNFYYYLVENFVDLTKKTQSLNSTDPIAIAEQNLKSLKFIDENLSKTFFALIRVVIQQNSIFFNDRLNAEIQFYGVLLLFFLFALVLLFLVYILPRSRVTQMQKKVSVKTLRLIPAHIIESLPGFKTSIFRFLRAN